VVPVLGFLATIALATTVVASVTLQLDLLLAGLATMAAVAAAPLIRRAEAGGWTETGRAARREVAKRVTDVVLAGAALVILLPLFAVIAVMIKLCDGGPVFFAQRRTGLDGHVFTMWKFRSMTACSEAADAPRVIPKLRGDARITPVGRILRRTSLDELPQLMNVLVGEMSIVGPRPLPPCEAAVVPDWAADRWQVRPGLTCYWQVGGRSDIAWDERMEMDVRYVRERSLTVDARLIARTFDAVVSGRGAY
jgi:lipopolysaccharide/colanic/teichoic acid biosynthesis glycosyltransferase